VFITRLEVFNRILRHNLRNQLDVINSHAEALEDPEHRKEILTATEKLNRLGVRARRIDHLMSKDPEPTTIDLADRIEAVRDEIESEDVAVTMAVPDGPTVVSDPEILTTVLRSPLENAVAFAESDVSISAESTERGCQIEISDDGPGIPAGDLDPVTAERETELDHSRGLGLWELKWGVNKLDGDLSFATDDGTTVTIHVPNLDM
jgi:signal transduction histidine kinase